MRVHGSVLTCPRSGARRRRALPHRGLYEFDARPSRLSRHDAGLRRIESLALRLAHPSSCASSTSTMSSAQSWLRAARRRALIVTTRGARRAAGGAEVRTRRARCGAANRPAHHNRVELGRERTGGATDRRFQRGQRADACSRFCSPGAYRSLMRARALTQCRPPSGRMEVFGGDHCMPLVIVDYAHTPDALSKALRAARVHCPGQLARGVWLRRRSRRRQASAHGRNRRGAGR